MTPSTQTGIRDPAMIDQVKKSLLTPIRTLTERLSDEELTEDGTVFLGSAY